MFFLLFLEPLPYDANFIITFVLPIQIVSRLAKMIRQEIVTVSFFPHSQNIVRMMEIVIETNWWWEYFACQDLFINLCIDDNSRNHGKWCTFVAQRTKNFAIFWPILAILSRIYELFDILFMGGGVQKLTNKRYETMMSVVMRVWWTIQ